MRSNYLTYFVLLISIALYSCNSAKNEHLNPLEIVEDQKPTTEVYEIAKGYALGSTFIDVNLADLLDKAKSGEPTTDDDQGKLRALTYRFYKHVKVIGGRYVTDLQSAKDINVSESVFEVFKDNLKEVNKFADADEKNGVKVEVPQITKSYLESLINEPNDLLPLK